MGQEIDKESFTKAERTEFHDRLKSETLLLIEMLEDDCFSQAHGIGGFELEGWLCDKKFNPAPLNIEFLKTLNNTDATTELAKFNFEFNSPKFVLKADIFSRAEAHFSNLLAQCNAAAETMDLNSIFIGILPTAKPEHFTPDNMTQLHRYRAMNNEILRARHGHGIKINIEGHDILNTSLNSVMLEAATTSFQLHFQIRAKSAHHYYNASLMASALVMAVSGNSPFLFQNSLWRETRIPLFEQAVCLGRKTPQRVTFGTGYIDNISKCFEENLEIHEAIIPMLFDKPTERFAHLALQNGVIWRWNRPIIGFDEDGKPHTRIEHRILPAGPSVKDMMANAAFYFGLTQYFGKKMENGETPQIDFARARHNFYAAARFGLKAQFHLERGFMSASDCVLKAIEYAYIGLADLGIEHENAEPFLHIIEERAIKGQTGAIWFEHVVEILDGDFNKALKIYKANQDSGESVASWPKK